MDTRNLFDEPVTERSQLEGDITTMGSPGLAQLHHLRALTAALEPARAQYAEAAVEQLRSLPASVRGQMFLQVLAEHPLLEDEPAVRELQEELGISGAAIAGTATRAAYARMEAILPVLAAGLAALENTRIDVATELGVHAKGRARLARDGADLLSWLLDDRVAPAVRAEELARGLRALIAHSLALREAARHSAQALLAETHPETIAARTVTPGWWPKPFRDAAVLATARALHQRVDDGRRYLEELHFRRFADAYATATNARP